MDENYNDGFAPESIAIGTIGDMGYRRRQAAADDRSSNLDIKEPLTETRADRPEAIKAEAGGPTEQEVSILIGTTLADAEHKIIVATLRCCGGNKTKAASVLGVSLKTLYNRLNDYGLIKSGSPSGACADTAA